MSSSSNQPVIFLSHGGGPSFFMDAEVMPPLKGLDKDSKAAEVLRNFVKENNIHTPSAILVLSAHWTTSKCMVNTCEKHSLLFDFEDFPSDTYKLEWPAPGAPDAGRKAKKLLEDHGIPCEEETQRGLDHGVFVPMKLVFPKADIPVTEVSMLQNADMKSNLEIGEALADLRKENILIIGSGFASHSGIMTPDLPWTKPFRNWLHDLITNVDYTPEERKKRFLEYYKEETFSSAHPSLEHFLPIAICCAVGGYKPGRIVYSDFAAGSLLNDHYMF